ncbi:MAG TPA: choice-of-anchor tandem repeat GloVer-containing protein [Terriglobales bacterium]|jgi:uncharacterized repeat protein (TIGR03803 family)|nr:choice-of-anchor tandem repeat GloVer-containing protein [Terriglobales bacterium]
MKIPMQPQSWLSGLCRLAASAALALGVLLPSLIASPAAAQTYTYSVVYSFAGAPNDGSYPTAGLVLDAQGNLYGTTSAGGTFNYGTVFKLAAAGSETVLYNFAGSPDGEIPNASLVMDVQGNLYGTTESGGVSSLGTVFKVSPTGNETVLYRFAKVAKNGANPNGVVRDAQGNLYGTTHRGGDGSPSAGTVFKVDTAGDETVLHSFGKNDGSGLYPHSNLVFDSQGNLYGTTAYEVGGSPIDPGGTIFRIDETGNFASLYTFTSVGYPLAGVVLDAQGNLYGTTYGAASGHGTVYKLDTDGNLTVLYGFTGKKGDGNHPDGGVVMDGQGNLYGTTYKGGTANYGTVYEVDTSGKETVLHSFTGVNGDGAYPYGDLVFDTAGDLYGIASRGGAHNQGTVFKLTHQ